MYCLPGSRKIEALIPAHPRFTRMYGVTNSIAFQAIQNSRISKSLILDNFFYWKKIAQIGNLRSLMSFANNYCQFSIGDALII